MSGFLFVEVELAVTTCSVHDGWGIALEPGIEGNAIENALTPNMDKIAKNHNFRHLNASGTAVGLSEGLMGNSEVGCVNHLSPTVDCC